LRGLLLIVRIDNLDDILAGTAGLLIGSHDSLDDIFAAAGASSTSTAAHRRR
jgi:hypothetical protein